MLEMLLFILLGIVLGILLGLLPGIHPNMIILAVPIIISLNLDTANTIGFVVSLGVANTFAEFIPSILLSAPDSESGFATLPGQRMLAKGKGIVAVRLAITGGLVSVAICSLLISLLALAIPAIYTASRNFIWIILIFFVSMMIFSEKTKHKIFWAAICFALSGIIGLLAFQLPIDRALVLFPIFTGLFALPHLIIQIRGNIQIPKQSKIDERSLRLPLKPAALGTAGGLLSGLLPGIGSAEIASVLTIEKNDHSFLSTMGALAVSNIMMSFLALWLIGNPRSGIAVALDQIISLDARATGLIIFSIILASAIAAPLTLWIANVFLEKLQKINYTFLSQIIMLFLLVAIGVFTGMLGLLLAFTCTGLGLFVNMVGIKRGLLMGILILPTILFFLGV